MQGMYFVYSFYKCDRVSRDLLLYYNSYLAVMFIMFFATSAAHNE